MRSVSIFAKICRTSAIGLVAAMLAATAGPAAANDAPEVVATTTPSRVLAVVSGGFWVDESGGGESESETATEDAANESRRGYYRSVAVRSQDNTSRLFLQRIWLSDDGPTLLDTREITELSDMKAYITDMRPEDSTGIAKLPGFVTFVYLKRDPATAEPDTWELFVDEFGDTAFTPATN